MNKKSNLLESIIAGIHEKKGRNITSIRMDGVGGSVCDCFVICEGNTPTQVRALADSIEERVRLEASARPERIHGHSLGEWIGMDYGSVIVHIFVPSSRAFYNLDNLWSDAEREQIPEEL